MKMSSNHPYPATVRAAQALLGVNAIIWLLFGVTSITRMTRQYPEQGTYYLIVGVLMFANVAAMLVSAWLAGRPRKWGFFLVLAVLLANILLTFTDQVGFFDIATLLLDLVILFLLFSQRRWYGFGQPQPTEKRP